MLTLTWLRSLIGRRSSCLRALLSSLQTAASNTAFSKPSPLYLTSIEIIRGLLFCAILDCPFLPFKYKLRIGHFIVPFELTVNDTVIYSHSGDELERNRP